MKVYQLIYTSVQHSLSDPELGLVNQSGLRVFSCTQGLTKQNIDETIRFATYRLPKNNEIKYTQTPCDPTVPFRKFSERSDFRTEDMLQCRFLMPVMILTVNRAMCLLMHLYLMMLTKTFCRKDISDISVTERILPKRI